MPKIFVDPGHGGEDTGAISHNGIFEKDLNLQMADLMRQYCHRLGIPVILSRYTDVNLVESHTARYANEWNADVFVALHCNGFADPSAVSPGKRRLAAEAL